jgi:hypothetical protein
LSTEQETITLDTGNLYLVLMETQDSDGFGFQVYDKLQHSEDNVFLSCLLRGMIEYSLKNTEECVNRGARAFKRDYAAIEDTTEVADGIPTGLTENTKTVGSA